MCHGHGTPSFLALTMRGPAPTTVRCGSGSGGQTREKRWENVKEGAGKAAKA
jgi:hypothetical protein